MLHAVRVFSRRPGSRLGTIALIGVALSQIPLWYVTGSARFLVLWLVAIGLSAVCAWRVPRRQRWLVGLGSLVSFLSVLFISTSTSQISSWWFVLFPLLGVVLVKLYLALSRRAVPLPAAGALSDQTSLSKPGIARWWRGLVALLIPLHALGLGLYWAYTDHACSQYDLVRRSQGCALAGTLPDLPPDTRKVQLAPSGALVASAAGAEVPRPSPPFTNENMEAYWQQRATTPSTISLWDLSTGKLLHTLEQPAHVLDMMFSPNDQLVATSSADDQTRIWSVDDGSLQYTLPDTSLVVFSADGSLLATRTVNEPNIRLWSMQDGTLLRTIGEDVSASADMVFSPDGSLLAMLYDKEITLWRVADGTLQQTIDTDQGSFDSPSLSFSPDGQILVTTGGEISNNQHTVRLWRVADGTLLHKLVVSQVSITEEVFTGVNSIAFSPDGTRLVVDIVQRPLPSTIMIWRVADGALLDQIDRAGPVQLVRFNDNGTALQIYSASLFENVRMYTQQIAQAAMQ